LGMVKLSLTEGRRPTMPSNRYCCFSKTVW